MFPGFPCATNQPRASWLTWDVSIEASFSSSDGVRSQRTDPPCQSKKAIRKHPEPAHQDRYILEAQLSRQMHILHGPESRWDCRTIGSARSGISESRVGGARKCPEQALSFEPSSTARPCAAASRAQRFSWLPEAAPQPPVAPVPARAPIRRQRGIQRTTTIAVPEPVWGPTPTPLHPCGSRGSVQSNSHFPSLGDTLMHPPLIGSPKSSCQ